MTVIRGNFGRRQRTPQEQGRDFEEQWAKRHGLDVQPGSGSTPRYKLDVGGRTLLASLKHTTHQSFRLTATDLREAVAGAEGPGARDVTPAMVISVEGFGEDVWVMRERDVLALAAGELKLDLRPSKRSTKRAGAVPAILREEEEE